MEGFKRRKRKGIREKRGRKEENKWTTEGK